MILYVNDNLGIVFLRRTGEAIIGYITGLIVTATTVTAQVVGFGPVSVTVNTYSTVTAAAILRGILSGLISTWSTISARMSALAHIYVRVFTRTIVRAFVNLPIVVTEVIKKISTITTIFKRNSRIDGD